ncbi:MAG: enoyl-CoA hydratase-related protein [Eubacteriales bacterium]|nr:enoyl-CoA hydratase-related protein [Eubacteriales bacterium]
MKNLLLDIKGKIMVLTINRPNALNALNRDTLKELKEILCELEKNDQIDVIIITGSGDKAFIAGADIKEMENMTSVEAKGFALLGHEVLNRIENINKLVIASVNGFALGGGCELALACDIRFASENAKFGQPEVGLGITPGFGGTQRLPRIVGKGIALELLLSGKIINAEEAFRIGLVNKVVPNALAEAEEFAQSVISKGRFAVKQIKQLVVDGMNMDLCRALKYEAEAFALCFSTSEQKEGMSAFTEKRKPKFS